MYLIKWMIFQQHNAFQNAINSFDKRQTFFAFLAVNMSKKHVVFIHFEGFFIAKPAKLNWLKWIWYKHYYLRYCTFEILWLSSFSPPAIVTHSVASMNFYSFYFIASSMNRHLKHSVSDLFQLCLWIMLCMWRGCVKFLLDHHQLCKSPSEMVVEGHKGSENLSPHLIRDSFAQCFKLLCEYLNKVLCSLCLKIRLSMATFFVTTLLKPPKW